MSARNSFATGFTVLLFFAACVKPKEPFKKDQFVKQNAPGSSIRLINITQQPADIAINGIPLTDSRVTNANGASTATSIGLLYFPSGTWPDATKSGGAFTIPTTLLDKSGKSHISIVWSKTVYKPGASPQTTPIAIDTTIANDPIHPTDYYLTTTGTFLKVPRPNTATSTPSNFKLRIVNLSDAADAFSLTGPVTLTYADGGLVNDALSSIPMNAISDYVEIRFGAYAFKLFGSILASIDPTKEYSQYPYNEPRFDFTNYSTGPPTDGDPTPYQALIFPPVQYFKPGGIYSVLVSRNVFSYPSGNGGSVLWPANSFRIVADYTPPVNVTFANLQLVNASPNTKVRFNMDGNALSDSLSAFGPYPKLHSVIAGEHQFAAIDPNGNVLVKAVRSFLANDNLTLWYYTHNGVPELVFSDNDVTSSASTIAKGGDLINGAFDGTLLVNSNQAASPWQARFLNLSDDISNVTFGNDLSLFRDTYADKVIDSASVLLSQGEVVGSNPYVINATITTDIYSSVGAGPTFDVRGNPNGSAPIIRVFQSDPGPPPILPGSLRLDVPAVYPKQFVADSATLYPPGRVIVPNGEPGLYTVALVGKGNVPGNSPNKCRMIIIKHNQ